MISFVSFDYFPPFDYLDADFTEVWSWSPNFEWLGYVSVNFLTELGSILVFAIIEVILIVAAVALKMCKLKCPCRWLKKNLATEAVWNSSLKFINSTFFEILVCTSVSMSMI